jgi:hypothetical protein
MSDNEYNVDRQIDNIIHGVNAQMDEVRATIAKLTEKVQVWPDLAKVNQDER